MKKAEMTEGSPDERIEFLKEKISRLEWDVKVVQHESIKERKIEQLEKHRTELRTLLEQKILFGEPELDDDFPEDPESRPSEKNSEDLEIEAPNNTRLEWDF